MMDEYKEKQYSKKMKKVSFLPPKTADESFDSPASTPFSGGSFKMVKPYEFAAKKIYTAPRGMSAIDRLGKSLREQTQSTGLQPWQNQNLPVSVRQALWSKRNQTKPDTVFNLGYVNGPNSGPVGYSKRLSEYNIQTDATGALKNPGKDMISGMNWMKPDGTVLNFTRPKNPTGGKSYLRLTSAMRPANQQYSAEGTNDDTIRITNTLGDGSIRRDFRSANNESGRPVPGALGAKITQLENKKGVELNTSIPGETPAQLTQRILSGKIDKDKLLDRAATFNWNIPGVPGMIARTVARKAKADPEPYMRSLMKVKPETITGVIEKNPRAFDQVSAAKTNPVSFIS